MVVDGNDAEMDVSLTDRAGWAVCLVGPEGELSGGTLGVDLEAVEPRSRGFVADYLTAYEQAYVSGQGDPGSEGWDAAANLLWSAKESALKVLRVGLRADTRSVEVTLGTTCAPMGGRHSSCTRARETGSPAGGAVTASSYSPWPAASSPSRRRCSPAATTSRRGAGPLVADRPSPTEPTDQVASRCSLQALAANLAMPRSSASMT